MLSIPPSGLDLLSGIEQFFFKKQIAMLDPDRDADYIVSLFK